MIKKRRVITTGISLIILIFVIVSLVVFAALSMSGAAADYRLNEKLAKRAGEYHEASNKANLTLEKIDDYLSAQYRLGEGEEAYFGSLDGLSHAVSDSLEIDGKEVAWKESIDENQILSVAIQIKYPREGETFYELKEWEVASEGDWEKEDRLPVYQNDNTPFSKEK